MSSALERKIVLVTRPTRLDDLVGRFNTVQQARFYVDISAPIPLCGVARATRGGSAAEMLDIETRLLDRVERRPDRRAWSAGSPADLRSNALDMSVRHPLRRLSLGLCWRGAAITLWERRRRLSCGRPLIVLRAMQRYEAKTTLMHGPLDGQNAGRVVALISRTDRADFKRRQAGWRRQCGCGRRRALCDLPAGERKEPPFLSSCHTRGLNIGANQTMF